MAKLHYSKYRQAHNKVAKRGGWMEFYNSNPGRPAYVEGIVARIGSRKRVKS